MQDGGNGHWYQFVPDLQVTWSVARQRSIAIGGDLATISNSSENNFVFSIVNQSSQAVVPGQYYGPFIGATRQNLQSWQWVDGTEWSYQPWGPGEPNNSSGGSGPEDCLALLAHPSAPKSWNDVTETGCAGVGCTGRTSSGYVIEWSADCNNDGIVDYGQIRLGQLPDQNANNIPDTCECAAHPELTACCPGDLNHDSQLNGADVGVLLAFWGDVTANTPAGADINRDGVVNGADLGLLLSHWGPCGG